MNRPGRRVRNVLDWGVTPAAIQVCLDDGAGTVEVPPVGAIALGSTGIVVPSNVSLQMDPESWFTYSGTGTAVLINGGAGRRHAIGVVRSTQQWVAGAETTSVGVHLFNARYCELDVLRAQSFGRAGLLLSAQGTGCNYNTIRPMLLTNNRYDIELDSDYDASTNPGGGWAHQNTFIGGYLKNTVGGADSANIRLNADGCLFLNVSVEGSLAQRSLLCSNDANIFMGGRWENTAPIEFTSAAERNLVFFGYGNLGNATNPAPGARTPDVIDAGDGNLVWGPRGMKVVTDGGQYGALAALTLQTRTTAATSVLLDGRDVNNVETFKVFGDGSLRLGSVQKRIDYGSAAPTTGTFTQGDVRFNTAPTAGGSVGWVCVTAGSPGTWKTFGAVAA